MSSKIKTILVGDSQVGKTAMIVQFVQGAFQEEYIATFSSERSTKEAIFNINKKEEQLALEIWDTVGQEQMRAVNKIFMKSAKLVLLVYDITNKTSLESLKNYWYNQILESNDKNEISVAVVGNKSDYMKNNKLKVKKVKNMQKKLMNYFLNAVQKKMRVFVKFLKI